MAKVYQAYPEYKDSGVEWLGVIPKDWEVMQLKRSIDSCVNGIWGNEPQGNETDTIVLRVADFNRDHLIINNDGFTYRKISDTEKKSRLLKVGDLLLEKSGGGEKTLVGQVVLFNKPFSAVTSNFVAKMTPLKGFSGGFLNYYFSKLYNERINYCSIKQNTGIQNLDSDSYLSEILATPSFAEAEKIAHFLDHETAKIDALIGKQQQLIALLKEKRQAMISHAVTKGLNPNVKMKDSGVEWLGDVPEHWKVGKLGYYAKISNGATPNRENKAFWENGNIPWLNSSKINDVFVTQAEQFITKDALLKTSVQPVKENDILMAITGEGQTRGRVAICKISATINQHLAAISITDKLIDHEFLFLWLRSQYERLRFESDGGGATKAAITCGEIGAFPVVIPTSSEQKEIVKYIFKKNDHFDVLEEKAQYQIQLLQERRTALISAAVTGKIDLRDWQAA